MKINRNSWHYKFIDSIIKNPYDMPESLCSYFWTLAFFLFLGLFGGLTGGVVVLLLGFLVWTNLFETTIAVGIVGIIFLMVCGGSWLWEHFSNKEPGVIRSYLIAKKNKVCPLIEYIDE